MFIFYDKRRQDKTRPDKTRHSFCNVSLVRYKRTRGAFPFLENKILRNRSLKMDMCGDVYNINDKCPS